MIINNCELYYAKLDPKRPNRRFSKQKPTWEVQIRTSDKAVVKHWEECNLKPKPIIPEEGDPYWRVNLKKRIVKADGTEADPVQVLNGNLEEVDPNTIGNGSIGNIRLFQYEYNNPDSSGIASILMAVQLTKHILYKAKPGESFEETETEIISATNTDEDLDEDEEGTEPAKTSPKVSVGSKEDEDVDF